jgi:3-phosphoshikimate 1-carboxyvinyltransferase
VGKSEIVNAGRWRLKESDRLRAMASELTKLGARIEEGEDSLTIEGSPSLKGGRVDAWGDHRIAMSMALAAIRCENPVELSGWQSVNKSYPGFWHDYERVEL